MAALKAKSASGSMAVGVRCAAATAASSNNDRRYCSRCPPPVKARRDNITYAVSMMRLAALACLLLSLLGCSQTRPITVGSKNFTEQIILGEIVAQQLERRLGQKVDRKLDLGGTLLAQQALESGQIDVYPEY